MQSRAARAVFLLMIAVLLLGSFCPAAAPSTVYKSDFTLGAAAGFAAGVSGRWSAAATSITPNGRHGAFLGEFGDQTVSLTLADLPPHREVTVSFSLYILKSWDGNQAVDPRTGIAVGPDVWSLEVSGGPKLLSTSFSNIARFADAGLTYPQAYPGSFPGATFPPGTGSAEINTLGYQFAGVPMDAVYPLSFTFPHTGSSLTLNFVGAGNLQGIADESWGLDNIEIRLDGARRDPAPPELDLQAFLVRIDGEIYVVGTAANRGDAEARVTLRAATLAVMNPLEFGEALEEMPLPLGVLAPGEQRSFGARFPGDPGPPGRGAALTLNAVVQWRGSPDVLPTQLISRDFNNLRLP